jgi:hypothetical protein
VICLSMCMHLALLSSVSLTIRISRSERPVPVWCAAIFPTVRNFTEAMVQLYEGQLHTQTRDSGRSVCYFQVEFERVFIEGSCVMKVVMPNASLSLQKVHIETGI